MYFIVRLVINTLAVLTGGYVLKGVLVDGVTTAAVVAVVLGLVNTFIKPILVFLTLPITLLTLGLFLLVINALMIMLVDHFIPGFEVQSFWWALAYSIVISVVNSFLSSLSFSSNGPASK